MRILRIIAIILILLLAGAGLMYSVRTNPIAMISGRQVTGKLITEPVVDWRFTDAIRTIAVETRPAAPHSVTTICFTYEGELYVPASNGSQKSWTYYAVADPRVRLKIGDQIYPAVATRITDDSPSEELVAAAMSKYGYTEEDRPSIEDVWLFRMRSPGVVSPAAGSEAAVSGAVDPGAAVAGLDVAAIVAAPDRDATDRALDERRRPAELLVFAAVQPGMRVADIGAGAGYTTELLARAVGPAGLVYAQNRPEVIKKYLAESWPARLAKPVMENVIRIDSEIANPLAGAQGLDLITMVYAYHDMLGNPDRFAMNKALFEALRPGGSLVVVDHRADPETGEESGNTTHRVDEALVRRELLRAGFRLADESGFLAVEDDPRTQPFFEMEGPTDTFVQRYVRPR